MTTPLRVLGTSWCSDCTRSKRFLDEYYGPVFAPPMIEAWTAAGTPEQCAASLRELAGDGAKSVALRITGWDQKGQFERLVNEVIPRLDA